MTGPSGPQVFAPGLTVTFSFFFFPSKGSRKERTLRVRNFSEASVKRRFWERSRMLRTHRVSVSFKPIARPPERRGRHRVVWSADSARGMGFAARRPPGQQCAAGIGTRTGTHLPCPGSPTACLPAAAAQWCLHRRSAGRASEIVMQPTSGASVRREPARPCRLVLMRPQESEEQEK